MRLSPRRHPLAVFRILIGLTQHEMAALIGRSAATIQAIELLRLPLSLVTAHEISAVTGVDITWLVDGNPSAPVRGQYGKVPYTRATFEEWRARAELPDSELEMQRDNAEMERHFRKALTFGATPIENRMVRWKLRRFLKGLVPEDKGQYEI